jgi:hypothetical protein
MDLGKFTKEEIDSLLSKSSKINDIPRRINFISEQFLGISYEESTLIGDKQTPEAFVINLVGVDCFTFLDYIEAMRLSESFSSFEENLKKVRYHSGNVAFETRNHFITDWRDHNPDLVDDITEKIGRDKTLVARKKLNEKEDGTFFISGLQALARDIYYIPSDAVDDFILDTLLTGDYIGIYSPLKGLDVSHVGIIIRKGSSLFFRHASYQKDYKKVVDQDFKEYIISKPGIVILRPK